MGKIYWNKNFNGNRKIIQKKLDSFREFSWAVKGVGDFKWVIK